jgi:N-acetylmuramoyl-L-alanine amidase-like protein
LRAKAASATVGRGRVKLLGAIVLVALALPGVARAGEASLVVREVPLGGGRALAAAAPRFDLVGLHWRGSGSVSFSTRSVGGRWSVWRPAAPEAEDAPDFGTREAARTATWRLGSPYWTGPSNRIRYRLTGKVRRLRSYFVRSTAVAVPPRRTSMTGSPLVVPRLGWSANERIRRGPPRYAPSLRVALVHHTAGSNSYRASQSAAIVRAIEVYHVLGNGWNDIGYNFLVDKYGQVFEGRYGGIDRNVVGAHAQGFNTGSAGVALLGTYTRTAASPAALRSLEALLAWKLDLAHVDPRSALTYLSGGNPRFGAGVPVFLRAVSAHRDTGFTTCPGGALYRQLPAIARATALIGLPKLYAPKVTGRIPGLMRFRARLSSALPWAVTVTDTRGTILGSGTATTAGIDWTWDARAYVRGKYFWSISAGTGVRPVTGTLGGKAPPLRMTNVTVAPPVISPNGDGVDDVATISYTLSVPATVTATLLDSTGETVSTLFADQLHNAGPQSFTFYGDGIEDGAYRIVLKAKADGRQVSASAALVVARTA